ncbi:hypothetical protein XIS1_390001 [Xenorhabdus innexi]|uniref:Uncharacterized protein n=1 Tax=Xenorhabdus innexi TaxID=290109 RepID=A0A1N6MXN1_9GAMM|nr:hypothetical protein XIS1_390001 [Xenorhabdus innexi]
MVNGSHRYTGISAPDAPQFRRAPFTPEPILHHTVEQNIFMKLERTLINTLCF